MEVNKSLYDDRIHIMSEIPPPPVSNDTNNLINQLDNEKNNTSENIRKQNYGFKYN